MIREDGNFRPYYLESNKNNIPDSRKGANIKAMQERQIKQFDSMTKKAKERWHDEMS